MSVLGHSDFDFLGDVVNLSYNAGMNPMDQVGAEGIFTRPRMNFDGSGGFVKFQNSNVLYNLHDAGNFMTGNAFKLIGVTSIEIKNGAQLNEFFQDSKADQKAIQAGSEYTGVKLIIPNQPNPLFKF